MASDVPSGRMAQSGSEDICVVCLKRAYRLCEWNNCPTCCTKVHDDFVDFHVIPWKAGSGSLINAYRVGEVHGAVVIASNLSPATYASEGKVEVVDDVPVDDWRIGYAIKENTPCAE